MTLALSTEGFVGSGTTDSTPPAIAIASPTPNTTPGVGGGFSATYATAAATPIVVNVTDTDGVSNLSLICAVFLFLDGSEEIAYLNGSFQANYIPGSFQTGITNGNALSFLRVGGWPGAGLVSNLSVGLTISVADAGGNVATTTSYWELPSDPGGDFRALVLSTMLHLPPTEAGAELARLLTSFLVIAPVITVPVAPVVGAADMVAAALGRLIWQLRS